MLLVSQLHHLTLWVWVVSKSSGPSNVSVKLLSRPNFTEIDFREYPLNAYELAMYRTFKLEMKLNGNTSLESLSSPVILVLRTSNKGRWLKLICPSMRHLFVTKTNTYVISSEILMVEHKTPVTRWSMVPWYILDLKVACTSGPIFEKNCDAVPHIFSTNN